MILAMSYLLFAAFFALGAIVASFIGVVAARLYTGQSFLAGRSRCDACNRELAPASLVPIVSYIVTGGHARCCSARVSWASPLTELLLGGLFALSYLQLGLTPALLGILLALALLLALVLYDLAHQILPTPLLSAFVITGALTGFLIAPSPQAFYETVGTALLISGSLVVLHLLSRGRAMGLADAPLTLGLALLVGSSRAFVGFIFSFWIGAVVGIFILLQRPAGSRIGVEVPFAPFLAAGFLLAYFTQWNPFIFIAALY
jgi:prepilin signal peptidase PulO-like enzyme (type II secretory pathway)